MKFREQFEKETLAWMIFNRNNKYYYMLYARWLEKRVPQWINVNDKLPDDNAIIDMMYLSGDIRCNVRWLKMFEQNNLSGTEVIEPVTHWRVHVIQPSNIKRGTEAEP